MTIWAKRILSAILLLGTFAAMALWIAIKTLKCEGFGCLGLGAVAGMAFLVHLACLAVGGLLIWLMKRDDEFPRWLIVLETLHSLPVLWFGGLLVLN